MNDALLVGRFEGFSDLLRNGQRLINGDRPLCGAIRQRRSFHQFEDQGLDAV